MITKSIIKLGMTVALVVCGVSLSSCSSEQKALTANDVENEVKRVLKPVFAHPVTVSFTTGYYEVDENELLNLAKLQANEVITFKAQNIIQNKKNYWGKKKIAHYFVEVALTEKGQKYVVTDEELAKWLGEGEIVDEDLVNPKADKKWPEDGAVIDNIPVVDDESEANGEGDVDHMTDEDYAQLEKEIQEVTSATKPAAGASSYEKALAKVNKTSHNVEAYGIELNKVRNVKCTQVMFEQGEGRANVIFEIVDTTPFGRILTSEVEGTRKAESLKFELYSDGWKLVK